MYKLLLYLIFIVSFSSCATKYVEKEIPVEVTKTEYIYSLKYDSVYVHDSIDRYVKGDTILIQKWSTKYKEKVIKDTILIRDSIPYYITNTKIVETNKCNSIQIAFITLGVFSFIALLVYVGSFLIKLIK